MSHDINALIGGLLEDCKDANLVIDPRRATQLLADAARSDAELMDPDQWAIGEMVKYKRRHNFKAPKPEQLELFDFPLSPDGIIVLSDGKERPWIKAEDISKKQIPLRMELIARKASEQMQAFYQEMAFWNKVNGHRFRVLKDLFDEFGRWTTNENAPPFDA